MTLYTTESEPRFVCAERHDLGNHVLVFNHAEQYREHMELAHHQLMPRPGESLPDAAARFVAAHPEVQDCPHCRTLGAPWARKEVH